jgi:2-(1,2-epoxy-1,2-dihydrophenyl)acetyl-CoA isomerase
MPFQFLIYSLDAGIARITLNRPDRLNSFNEPLHAELRQVLDSVQADASVRVLIITGAGRGFCAGQDLGDRNVAVGAAPPDLGYTLETFYIPLITQIAHLRCPVIAAVNGVAAGSGASLALACDLIIAKESASFVQAFSKIGLIPDAGSSYFLPRAVGTAVAMGLALTGDKCSASQAAQWGMIWKCVPDAAFDAEVTRLAEQLAQAPPLALKSVKETLRSSGARSLDEALRHERDTQRTLGRSEDYREGVTAFMEKRPAQFIGR